MINMIIRLEEILTLVYDSDRSKKRVELHVVIRCHMSY